MKIISKSGAENCAYVYILEDSRGRKIETVESFPEGDWRKKYVLIISSLYGCPVKCRFCDASLNYQGKLSSADLLSQIELPLKDRFGTIYPPVEKFKVQFSRMGEPAFNSAVLKTINSLLQNYDQKVIVSLSTVAPAGSQDFFYGLRKIKQEFNYHHFQLQFSIHSTDSDFRDSLIPLKKLSFSELAYLGGSFRLNAEDKKITLNFALTEQTPFDPEVLRNYFDPRDFLIKITPLNPTTKSAQNGFQSLYRTPDDRFPIEDELRAAGYEVIVSIGNLEENRVGSNCGQYLQVMSTRPSTVQKSLMNSEFPVN